MAINILHKRANSSQSTNNTKIKKGALVVDPNKMYDNVSHEITDRYVKQEDLVIYASLKAIKKPQQSITEDSKQMSDSSDTIYINFLNPLRNKTKDGFSFKNKMTAEWTDFFAPNSVDDNDMLDPETFGISNISVQVNADQLPRIQMEFIDVQGRVLFERGNDPNSPYNIFFTYPYPKFVLVIKGYYGRAVDIPLVLLKSNTHFDPSSGNYVITVDFQSEVFYVFNNFLIIYGYVAPYMFKTDDGSYLGQKILNQLYAKQEPKMKAFAESNGLDPADYSITTNPTLFNLGEAIMKIPTSSVSSNNETNSTVVDTNKLNDAKFLIEEYSKTINNFFANKYKTGIIEYTDKTNTKENVDSYTVVDLSLIHI